MGSSAPGPLVMCSSSVDVTGVVCEAVVWMPSLDTGVIGRRMIDWRVVALRYFHIICCYKGRSIYSVNGYVCENWAALTTNITKGPKVA